ncbi:hypothetical protein SAMN05192544_1024117 [Paraburkholderia hospita]|jgi:hypothetical protein|nr:hypothetical protein SAMN05192544_1024117 [Paraburkholderia hospita]
MFGDFQNLDATVDRFSVAVSLYGKADFNEALALLEPLLRAQSADAQVLNLAAA